MGETSDRVQVTAGGEPAMEPSATGAVLGGNAFVNMTPEQMLSALARWAGTLGRRPSVVASEVLRWGSEELRVIGGVSTVAPDPKDKRFADPAWTHPVWRRVAQTYLTTRGRVLESVDELGLDVKSADRARFALTQLTEATAPTNNLLGNPAALKRAWSTRGRSLRDGSRHFLYDLRHNRGMPSQVDTRPFRVGETIAVTPGVIVHRSEVFELIQYKPTTAKISSIPTVVFPPQINRYYFLDMSPGRSFVEHAVTRGVPTFLVSWRNPGRAQADWNLDTYAAACLEAMEVAADLLRQDRVNIIGFCSGGMVEATLLSHLAQTGNEIVNAAAMAVSLVDTTSKSSLNTFMTERTLRSSLSKSRRKGILDGESLGRVFSWMRPNDLVWNYWVSNYLLGENPPAFDVLAWNADTTNLPAALHADFLNMWAGNSLMKRGAVSVLGSPVDLSTVKNDMYVVGALTDHLVPWSSAYAATQTLGGNVRFVLSNSGHIQALVNPPGNPKASFFENPDNPPDPDVWLKGASKVAGSWWDDWADWTIARSGDLRNRPRSLGNTRHPALEPAPGSYVTG